MIGGPPRAQRPGSWHWGINTLDIRSKITCVKSKPDRCPQAVRVDAEHKGNMVVALFYMRLSDADLIHPDPCIIAVVSVWEQKTEDVLPYLGKHLVYGYGACWRRCTLTIR